MPEISRFFGIIIRMFFDDHPPPHLHADYSGRQALMALDPIGVIESDLPQRALSVLICLSGSLAMRISMSVVDGFGEKAEYRMQEAVGHQELGKSVSCKRIHCVPTVSRLLPSEFLPVHGRTPESSDRRTQLGELGHY